jgi:hypothetical protein
MRSAIIALAVLICLSGKADAFSEPAEHIRRLTCDVAKACQMLEDGNAKCASSSDKIELLHVVLNESIKQNHQMLFLRIETDFYMPFARVNGSHFIENDNEFNLALKWSGLSYALSRHGSMKPGKMLLTKTYANDGKKIRYEVVCK